MAAEAAGDLVVGLASVREATEGVRVVAQRCGPVSGALREVSAAMTGADTGLAADELQVWADEVQRLCAQVVEHAARARAACEAVVALDRELGR